MKRGSICKDGPCFIFVSRVSFALLGPVSCRGALAVAQLRGLAEGTTDLQVLGPLLRFGRQQDPRASLVTVSRAGSRTPGILWAHGKFSDRV